MKTIANIESPCMMACVYRWNFIHSLPFFIRLDTHTSTYVCAHALIGHVCFFRLFHLYRVYSSSNKAHTKKNTGYHWTKEKHTHQNHFLFIFQVKSNSSWDFSKKALSFVKFLLFSWKKGEIYYEEKNRTTTRLLLSNYWEFETLEKC